MTDLGDLSRCLGSQVTQGKGAVLLSQSTYFSRLLERFRMKDCKPIKNRTLMNLKKELNLAEIC